MIKKCVSITTTTWHINSCPTWWRIYASINWDSIGSDNGLSPIRRQAIIWTNAGLLWIRPEETNVSEILFKIQNFSFTKMHLKISSAKRRTFCPKFLRCMPPMKFLGMGKSLMETFSSLLAICAGNSPVTDEFAAKKASDAELWCFLWSAPE